MKRMFDIAASLVGLAVFAPTMATVATVIAIDDRGNPLFVQERIGHDGNPFWILKFRTMRHGQVTPVGRWLRRTGLDELPQFVNVLAGHMSIVGPRPLTAADLKRLGWDGPEFAWRRTVKPGITGLAQVYATGRGASAAAALDAIYVEQESLVLDSKLVAISALMNVVGKNRVRGWLAQHATRSSSAHFPVST